MKKLTLLITAVIFSISMSAQDPHWNTDGNAGTSPINDFVGTTDNTDLRFRTFDTFRMALTSPDGWLGLNTTAPDMMFHVDDGGILSTGTTGTNPDLGAGTRLMWIPDRPAFLAGAVGNGFGTDDWWDAPNVGAGAAALGIDHLVSGASAMSLGRLNQVTGDESVALGLTMLVEGNNALGFGLSNDVMGNNGIAN